MSQIDKLVARAVAACVAQEVLIARAEDRDRLDGFAHRVAELERLELQNAERIRALERHEDHSQDYVPAEVMRRGEALLAKLKAIG
jgi:hypothetical protein